VEQGLGEIQETRTLGWEDKKESPNVVIDMGQRERIHAHDRETVKK